MVRETLFSGLTFSPRGCILHHETGFPAHENPGFRLISSAFSAKVYEDRPSFKSALLLMSEENQHGKNVSSCLAGHYPVRLVSRFLVGPT